MRREKWKSVISMLCVCALLAGCSSASPAAQSTQDTAQTEASMAATEDAAAAESTQETGTSQDTGTSQEAAPAQTPENGTEERIIAGAVALVEILDAMDVPMVGVPTSAYDLPESVADATRIGNPMEPDMEVIASLEPTVVVSITSLEEDLRAQIEALGAEAMFVTLSGVDDLKETITALGTRFGVEDRAQALIDDIESREAAVRDIAAGKESPSVLIIFGAGDSFMVASENTYVGDIAKRAGATNVITDAPAAFSPVDMEYLADKNPDFILLMAHANPQASMEALQKEFETNAAWQNFDAVKNEKVVALQTGIFGMSANLSAPEAMEMMAEILYEE
ncbi:MAG: ABC transporter substrate-binding protein [Lachnospiraceae bacterium]|nr:ABC transporter substrate-binding protein [Lachnospiraceae bacterium]